MNSAQLYGRLLSYAKPYWSGFAAAAVAMLITAAAETAFPALLKPVLDKGFSPSAEFKVWWVPLGLLLLFLIRGVSGFLSTYCMSWIANNVLRDLRRAMFDRILLMPASSFDAQTSGQLISRIISDVNGVTSAATNAVNTIVRDSLILIGLLGWLFWLNWKLTLVVFALLPLLGGLTLVFSRRMRNVSRTAMKATADMTRSVEEAIFGNRVIKIYQGQSQESKRFEEVNSEFRSQSMKMTVAHALQTPISQFIAAIGVAVVLTIALVESRSGQSTIGDFISFVTAMLMMLGPLRHLSDVNAQLQKGLAAAESVFHLIDEKSELDSGQDAIGRTKGNIDFFEVSLVYENSKRSILSKITLSIRAGETVAFVGPSGGGKTSIVNLIPRLYEPTSGLIRIDGIPIHTLTLASLRSQISLVSQDIVLFNDSIRNNIIYGSQLASDDEVRSVLSAADLLDFVDSLPDGINTIVGDRGVLLSGGQKQRVAIARALLKNAPILILDEATSSLDSTAEANVKASIDQLRKGRTTLVVAHRLSTIANADRIYVIDTGQILAQGTHLELLERSQVYSRLYAEIQTGNKDRLQENS